MQPGGGWYRCICPFTSYGPHSCDSKNCIHWFCWNWISNFSNDFGSSRFVNRIWDWKKKTKKNYAIQKLNLKNWSWKIHALSGCKKQNLWNTWNNFVEVTETFTKKSWLHTKEWMKESMPMIERFATSMYKRTTNRLRATDAIWEIFVKGDEDV